MLYAGSTSSPSATRHTLTITYSIPEGTAPATYTATYAEGSSYGVPSPNVTGYTPSQARVEGIMGEEDIAVTVTYSINSYTNTITYSNLRGVTLHSPYTDTLEYGESFSVTSPLISGHTADQLVVSGTMPARALTTNVHYTQIPPSTPDTVECNIIVEDITNGEIATVLILINSSDIAVTDSAFTLTCENNTVTGTTIDGKAEVSLEDLATGQHTITVTLANGYSTTATINVEGASPVIDIEVE